MAKIAAPSLPGSRPSIFGGSLRWNSGSATPQNNMPVAIVVQRVTANQRQRSRSGFASGPPMVVRPKGESAMAARSARNRTLLIVKTGPKLRNIQSLNAVSESRKRAPCPRQAAKAVASTASGQEKKTEEQTGGEEGGKTWQ